MNELKQLQVIWGALVGGVVLYTLVACGLMVGAEIGSDVLDPSIMNIVGAAIMVYMGAAVFARRLMVGKIPSDAPAEAKVTSYRMATIVSLALMESGGLILITLALVSSQALWALAGGGAAAALMFMARPSAEEIGLG